MGKKIDAVKKGYKATMYGLRSAKWKFEDMMVLHGEKLVAGALVATVATGLYFGVDYARNHSNANFQPGHIHRPYSQPRGTNNEGYGIRVRETGDQISVPQFCIERDPDGNVTEIPTNYFNRN